MPRNCDNIMLLTNIADMNINRNSMLYSFLNGSTFAGATTALTKNKTGQKDTRSASEEAVSGAVSNILNGINNQVNTKDDGVSPTGTVRVGYQFNIIMSSDVQIKPYLP